VTSAASDPFLTLKLPPPLPHTSIVHSKLDYYNSLFLNLDSTQIQRLQCIQSSLALNVARTTRHQHITPVPKSKSRAKISERIRIKVLSITYNFPAVLHIPSRTLHHSANLPCPILLLSHPFSTRLLAVFELPRGLGGLNPPTSSCRLPYL